MLRMQQIMNVLPMDVVRYIIPYTYNVQNKTLLNDIKNYTETKIKVLLVCSNYFAINDDVAVENELLYTLFDYIYMTSNIHKYIQVFTRNSQLKTRFDVYNYVVNLQKKTVNTQINIIWGLLTQEERNDIIVIFQKKYQRD